MKDYFRKLCNHRLKITKELVCLNVFEQEISRLPKSLFNVALELVNLAKCAVWVKRCEVKYYHLTFTGDSSLKTFIFKLKFRIQVDNYRCRDDRHDFYLSWGFKDIFTHDWNDNISFTF